MFLLLLFFFLIPGIRYLYVYKTMQRRGIRNETEKDRGLYNGNAF